MPIFDIPAKMHSNLSSFYKIAIALGLSIPCFAQHSIEGRVIDEWGEPLTYAHVVLLDPVDSTLQYYDITDNWGYYQLKGIKPGDYLMQFSFDRNLQAN